MGMLGFLLPGIGGLIEQGLNNAGVTGAGDGSNDALMGDHGLINNPTGAWDNFKNGQTNEINYKIAQENLEYQKERNAIEDARYRNETAYNRKFAENQRAYERAFAAEEQQYQRAFAEENRDYERALQQTIFDREDTALERQASSLSSMGINPLSQNMNGLGSGQVIQSAAPSASSAPSGASAPSGSNRGGSALHNDFQMQDMGNISALFSLFQGISSALDGTTNRDLLRQQTDYQRLVNDSQATENAYQELKLQEEIKSSKLSNEEKEKLMPYTVMDKKASAERNKRVNDIQEKTGMNDMSSPYEKIITDIISNIDKAGKNISDKKNDTPLGTIGNTLQHTVDVVGDALSNTVGAGAKKIFQYWTNNRKKNEKKNFLNQGR